ncbi:MAG: DUF177 domain-containing protein [Gemmatimonadota bacterium]
MLRIDLAALKRGPLRWSETVDDPGRMWPELSGRLVGPMTLTAAAETTAGGEIRLTGRLAARLSYECRRCLADVELDWALPLALWFRKGAQEAEGESLYPLNPEGGTLDLVPALRQELLLGVPEDALCRADCPGLCPECGAPREEESCRCGETQPDPRWDALRSLLKTRAR